MRILFVTPYVPASVRSRPYGFIKQLSKKHSVTVVCLGQPAWETNYLHEIQSICEAVYLVHPNRITSYARAFLSIPSGVPLSVTYSASPDMHHTVNRLMEESQYDLIHTDFIRAGQFTSQIQGTPKIYDAVDCLTLAYYRAFQNEHTLLLHRALAYFEWLKIRNYEPKLLRSFDHAIISSPADKEYLANNGTAIDVVPNGVDLDYFHWNSDEPGREDSLIFLGKMNYYVNVDSILYFCRYIYPIIKSKREHIKLSIVGWNPTKKIYELTKDPSIQVTGAVPDIRPYLARATVIIAPMISGSGILNKILQALAVGTPVVATSIACQALQVKDGEHLLVADEPEEYADAVIRLLMDNNLRKKISFNARQYVEQHHNWQQIGDRLEQIYIDTINNHQYSPRH